MLHLPISSVGSLDSTVQFPMAAPSRTSPEILPDDQLIPGNLHRSSYNSTSQLAIVGSNLCPIESLNYESFENDSFKRESTGSDPTHVTLKWVLCLLVGILTGAVGFFNNLAIESIAGTKFMAVSNLMLSQKYGWAFGVFSVSNFLLLMFASALTALVAPAAGGSGIPEVRAYLNGVDSPGIFSFRTLVVKIVGCIAVVSSSLHVGKAGPMVHTGACIAALFGQDHSPRLHWTCRWLHYFRNDKDRRDLVTYGAAAGVAAAFRGPVGGVMFALESLSSWWRNALVWRALFTTAVVAVVLQALVDICESGKCGLFGKGGLIMFEATSDAITYHMVDLPLVILLGVIGGILGCLYNFFMEKVLRICNLINEKGRAYTLLLAGTVSLLTSCVLFGLPWLASCSPCPVGTKEACPSIGQSGKFQRFQCPPDHYNDLASLFLNTNDDTIQNLYTSGTNDMFHPFSMLLFLLTSYLLGILSYGVVAPSGLFVPLILTGAIYGRFVGMLMDSCSDLDHSLLAVLGSASLLGGTMRMTVSVCVVILEITNNLLLLPLVMLVLLISKTVADSFNSNIYDMILKLKGLPYLESIAEPYMRQLTVGNVVTGPLQVFNRVEKVGNIVHVLKTTGHHGFPVIDELPLSDSSVLYGLVLRAHLLALLKKKDFFPSARAASSKGYPADGFPKPIYEDKESIEGIELSPIEKEMFVDLHRITNTSPYTVTETMSLAKALLLFRAIGLRHLLIIPKSSSRAPVVGILTRHDFMPEHIFGLHPSLAKSRWKRLRLRSSYLIDILKRSFSDVGYTWTD